MQMSKAQSQAITAEVHAGSVSLSMGPLPNIQEIAVTPKMPRIVSNLSTHVGQQDAQQQGTKADLLRPEPKSQVHLMKEGNGTCPFAA